MSVKKTCIVLSLLLFLGGSLWATQDPAQAGPGKGPGQMPTASSATPDHAKAYYHFMLARRYKELAGIYNRGDYIDRAISEYKQAIAGDPTSLFLRVELAELYWRSSRITDAVNEAEAVLKEDPDYPDAHRLLARIYFHMLDNTQADRNTTK